jgi:hypothetical protein
MEHGWVITVEAAGDAGEITEDQVAALMDQLPDRAAAVSGEPRRYTATFNLHPNEGDRVEDVTRVGARAFQAAAHRAGLPDWPIVRLEVMTFAEQDADLERPAFPELVGIKEIAGILAVSPQRAHQLTKRDDFPDPIARLAAGPVWTRPSLERFVDEWRTDKPDVSEVVAQIDGIIGKLTAARNSLVHGRLSTQLPGPNGVHLSLREILDAADVPQLPNAVQAAGAAVAVFGGGGVERAPTDIVDREPSAR